MSETLTVKIVSDKETKTPYETLMGGDNTNPTWVEYIADKDTNLRKYLEVLKHFVETNDMVGMCGDEQDDNVYLFSDDFALGFTWRAWGDFMQAVVNKQEGYMTYYIKY